jgi:hypothetical protein
LKFPFPDFFFQRAADVHGLIGADAVHPGQNLRETPIIPPEGCKIQNLLVFEQRISFLTHGFPPG